MCQNFVNKSEIHLVCIINFYQPIHKLFKIGSKEAKELLCLFDVHSLCEKLVVSSQDLLSWGWTDLVGTSSMFLWLFATFSNLFVQILPLFRRHSFTINNFVVNFPFDYNIKLQLMERELHFKNGSVGHDNLLFMNNLAMLWNFVKLPSGRKRQLNQ